MGQLRHDRVQRHLARARVARRSGDDELHGRRVAPVGRRAGTSLWNLPFVQNHLGRLGGALNARITTVVYHDKCRALFHAFARDYAFANVRSMHLTATLPNVSMEIIGASWWLRLCVTVTQILRALCESQVSDCTSTLGALTFRKCAFPTSHI